ncbi:MAG: CAP domain-containing protein [Halanaerobiales bacterium]
MKIFKLKNIALVLAFILFFNIFAFAIFGSQRVQANFWEEHKGNIFTVIQGFFMLWIINLFTGNSSADDIVSSTINRVLNIGNNSNQEIEDDIADGETDINDIEVDAIINREVDEDKVDEDKNEIEVNEDGIVSEEELEMLSLLNKTREEHGLRALEINRQLSEVAREKAQDMIDNNYFAHNSPTFGSPFEMIKDKNIEYSLAGENLAEAWTIQNAFDSLMDSPDHRDNILKARYDNVGIAVIRTNSKKFMIVQLFIDSPNLN